MSETKCKIYLYYKNNLIELKELSQILLVFTPTLKPLFLPHPLGPVAPLKTLLICNKMREEFTSYIFFQAMHRNCNAAVQRHSK